jgi:hypothetical protein
VFFQGQPKISGRQQGTPNKVSVSAKEAFQLAFDANGGRERPVQWIKEDADNQRVFFQIYSKLFPIDLSANALATGPKHLPLLSSDRC